MGFIQKKTNSEGALARSAKPKKIVLSKLTMEERSNLFEQFAIEIGQMKYEYYADGSRQLIQVGNYITNKDLNERFKAWLQK